nr:major head protein [uncultured phage]
MANTVFPNKVIEAKAKDILTTQINARSMMTIDTSLTQNAGMVKTINTYTYTGAAEEVAAGSGNSTRGSIAYVGKDYTVKMVQQAFDYLDEDFMKDPVIVDFGIKGATSVMTNDMTSKFYAALATTGSGSAELVTGITFAKGKALSYDVIVDAISELNLEDESKVFIVIPNAWKAALRKDADYKSAQMGEVIYNGQVGTICGIPVIATKALTDKAYVMTNEAVTLFLKKDVEVEQDRDADKRKNSVYLRDCYVCALTDATKACKITEAAS